MKKRIFTIALAAALVSAMSNAAEPSSVRKYFDSYLSGERALYSSGKGISHSSLDKARAEVWREWSEANKAFDEEKLADPQSLSKETAAVWNLPAELEENAVMNYYWGLKGEPAGEGGVPMFLYLHGSGPRDKEWETGLKLAGAFGDSPSVYFIPQIPNEGKYYRWWQRAKQYAWEKLLRQALASGIADPCRIYFFGISEGGYGSQRLASFYADYLAGAGPMAGGEPLKNAPAENLRNTAFSLRTGANDVGFYRNKLTGYTKRSLDSLSKKYPDEFVHHIELIPGFGHAIDYKPTTPWLRQYARNPYPRHVTWENFEMDSVYRTGFYNLYVNERSNPDFNSRTFYDMTIENNRVNLTVSNVAYTTTELDSQWDIALDFARSYTPATSGSVTIYLDDHLVDLSSPVTIVVNGHKVYHGKLKLKMENLVNSCAAFFDPMRLYPAAVKVDISEKPKAVAIK